MKNREEVANQLKRTGEENNSKKYKANDTEKTTGRTILNKFVAGETVNNFSFFGLI